MPKGYNGTAEDWRLLCLAHSNKDKIYNRMARRKYNCGDLMKKKLRLFEVASGGAYLITEISVHDSESLIQIIHDLSSQYGLRNGDGYAITVDGRGKVLDRHELPY